MTCGIFSRIYAAKTMRGLTTDAIQQADPQPIHDPAGGQAENGHERHQNGRHNGDTGRDELTVPMLSLRGSEVAGLAGLFKLLSDRTRLTILQLLSGGERNVTALCKLLQLPQPTVSHHLGLLRFSGLIDNRRSGKQIFYRLNGRISPAAVGRRGLEQTKGADEVYRDTNGDGLKNMPDGMQIKGPGFAVQILTAGEQNTREQEATQMVGPRQSALAAEN
jgi:DNA-binding transcriptional ArsR family regulator